MYRQKATLKHAIGRDMSPALIHALDNPVRRQILRMFTKRKPEWSPVDLAKAFRINLSHLSYHARALSELGVTVETRTEQVRGSKQHFYTSNVADNKLVRKILAETKADDKEALDRVKDRRGEEA